MPTYAGILIDQPSGNNPTQSIFRWIDINCSIEITVDVWVDMDKDPSISEAALAKFTGAC